MKKSEKEKRVKEPKQAKTSKAPKTPKVPKTPKAPKASRGSKAAKKPDKVKAPKEKREIPFYQSIRSKLIGAFLVPVIAIIVLGVASYQRASVAITNSYKDSSVQTIDMMQQYLELIVVSEKEEFKSYLAEQDLNYYYKNLLERSEAITAKNSYTDKLRDKLARDSKISGVFFLSDEGRSIYSVSRNVVDDAYTQFKNSTEGQAVLAAPYDWHIFGQDVATDEAVNFETSAYALRLVRKFNDMPQVLVVNISTSTVRDAMQSMDPGEGGYVILVTSDGAEFYSDAGVDTTEKRVYGTDFYQAAIDGEAVNGTQMVEIDGEEYLFVYNKMENCDALLVSLIHSETLLGQTADIKQLSVVLTIIASIVALVLGVMISGNMAGTIHYILRQLRKVAKGDLTVHLTTKRKDELGLLCDGVNGTVENVKKLIVNVNDVSQQVGESAAYVASASTTFMETSQDIQNAVSEIEIGVNRLDTGSGDCLNQMDSLSGKINNVSSNAGEIEKLTNATGDTINSGISSVQGLTKSAESTAEITRHVISSIEELEAKSKSIGNIVSAINEIAEQTNLLSLNASIEAARAGEAGRGFAVVAEEIRKLADQCLVSAGQISRIVEEIISQTGDVVNIARQAEEVVSSQSGAVEDTTFSFRQIDDQVEKLLEALQTISSNVQEMNGARNETLNAIESISAASTETAACSNSVYDAAGTQLKAIQELDHASQQLAGKADSLLEILSTFHV